MRKSATQWLDDLGNSDKRVAHEAQLKLGGLSAADSWMAAELSAALESDDPRRRFGSLIGLSCLARDNALGAEADDICRRLISVARSDPKSVNRQAALTALGRCPAQADVSVPAIVGVVGIGDPHVRAEGIRALTALGRAAAPAAGFLVSALEDQDESVAEQAAIALKFVPVSDPAHVQAVIAASVSHQDPEVRSQLEAAVQLQGYQRAGSQ